jgi:hypothetical protein
MKKMKDHRMKPGKMVKATFKGKKDGVKDCYTHKTPARPK